jgi:hypothetical protein
MQNLHVISTGCPRGEHLCATAYIVLQSMLSSTMPGNYDNVMLTFSARTSANQTQDIIDAKMDKRRKGVYGPPAGKSYAIFVDDLNMPQREKYFAQPPIELLRQWMDHGGWFERTPPCAFRRVVDSQVRTLLAWNRVPIGTYCHIQLLLIPLSHLDLLIPIVKDAPDHECTITQ